jgi:hypothetical protein
MELYLRWLEKHECQPGEESPLGLILCAGKSAEHALKGAVGHEPRRRAFGLDFLRRFPKSHRLCLGKNIGAPSGFQEISWPPFREKLQSLAR